MDFKDCRVSIKADGQGIVEGWASRYESTPDRSGDIVIPGAYTKTLAENGGCVPVLFGHSTQRPIGVGLLSDRPQGLWISAQLDLDVEDGKTAWSLARKGALPAFSIGYDTRQSRRGRGGVRELTEIALFEVSLVPVPAEVRATVESVKSADLDVATAIRNMARQARGLVRELDNRAHARTVDRFMAAATRANGHARRLIGGGR